MNHQKHHPPDHSTSHNMYNVNASSNGRRVSFQFISFHFKKTLIQYPGNVRLVYSADSATMISVIGIRFCEHFSYKEKEYPHGNWDGE